MMETLRSDEMPSTREWKKIDPHQRDIIERFRASYPIRLGALAKALGVEVKLSSLPANQSGQIAKEESGYKIRINRHEARARQRFTLAHELAHFLLHRDVIDRSTDGITDNVLYRSGAPERVEYEANKLAAELLIPEHELLAQIGSRSNIVTSERLSDLAEHFGASKVAVEVRLDSLGIEVE
jgi:Zn-dependent peptidase ImmA (M78 family)